MTTINYFVLQAFAEEHRVDYNALCAAVHEALEVPQKTLVSEPTPALTPEALRAAGHLYCPQCYTFGNDHRFTCSFRGQGMAHHVTQVP